MMDKKNRQMTDILYHTNPDFILREICGDRVLVPVGKATESINGMIEINETFCELWKLFLKPNTIAHAIDKIMEEYEGEDIRSDVVQFVEELVEHELLIKEER